MPIPETVLVLVSGGIDSVTLLHQLMLERLEVSALSFDYGQTHIKELAAAGYFCGKLGIQRNIVELHRIKNLFRHSALTDGDGDIIVPNRNMVFLSIAAGIAASQGIQHVAIGCNQDDAAVFPDCRPDFMSAMVRVLSISAPKISLVAPYLLKTKKSIVAQARQMGIDLDKTWSCYRGGNEPCGECLACKSRASALL